MYPDAFGVAVSGTNVQDGVTDAKQFFGILRDDVKHGRLPSVSWIVAPEAYTEHPAWPAGFGAWYTAQVLNTLTSVPEVWSKTALLVTFDENDGFFDHVVSPYPNVGVLPGQSTVPLDNEFFAGKAGELIAGVYGGADGNDCAGVIPAAGRSDRAADGSGGGFGAFRAARDLYAGITYVNAPTIGAEVHLPFGGTKATGNGHREGGQAAIDFYTEWKSVYVDYSDRLQRAQIDRPE